MHITFVHQALLGTRVYGVGETADLPDLTAKALIHQGVAEPADEKIREATAYVVKEARRATKRGRRRETRSDHTPG